MGRDSISLFVLLLQWLYFIFSGKKKWMKKTKCAQMTLGLIYSKYENWNRSTCLASVKVSTEFVRCCDFRKWIRSTCPFQIASCVCEVWTLIDAHIRGDRHSRPILRNKLNLNVLSNGSKWLWRRYDLLHMHIRIWTICFFFFFFFISAFVPFDSKTRISLTNSTAAQTNCTIINLWVKMPIQFQIHRNLHI